MSTTLLKPLMKAGLSWLVLLTLFPVAKGFAQQAGGTEERGTIVWPSTAPYRRVGDPRNASFRKVEDVPIPVYKEALRQLGGNPSTWYISNDMNFAGTGKRIVLMLNETSIFCCLVDPSKWVQLNTPNGIPYINDVMGSYLQRFDVMYHTQQLTEYVEHVALLYKGLHNFVLTKKFLHDVEKDGIKDWLTSTEKRPSAFRTYFHDPIINRHADRTSIRSNIINNRGAVEEWTLIVKASEHIEIASIQVRELRKRDTFTFAYVN